MLLKQRLKRIIDNPQSAISKLVDKENICKLMNSPADSRQTVVWTVDGSSADVCLLNPDRNVDAGIQNKIRIMMPVLQR